MKRRHLVVLISAVTLLTIIFMMAVTIGVGVGTDQGREQIRHIIERELAGQVHGKVHIGRIRRITVTGFTLDSFAIRDLEDSLLVSLGRTRVQYDPRDLLDSRLLLRNVEVEHPVIRLRQYEKGDWNFQRIFRDDGRSAPGVPGRRFGHYVVLDSVRVRDGEFILTRPWEPDDTLRGAKRDSAIKRNLANPEREIRRNTDGLTHTHRWADMSAFLPRVRIADPDSSRFGQLFVVEQFDVEEFEPPFSFRNGRGRVEKRGDSVFIDMKHFDLPASSGSANGRIWWGSGLPVRVDVRIKADSVSLKDVAWVYKTLPREGGGPTELRIRNNADNLRLMEYQLANMDIRTGKSRLVGAMTFVAGGPVLGVTNVNLRAAPVNFDLFRTLAGEPLPVDWQGNLFGTVRGPGGPLTNFVVEEADVTFHDAHVRGAVSHLGGRGELDILDPELTAFHGFEVNVGSLDLRSIEYLFPAFPRIGGTVAGTATLDSVWLDVRFSKANVTHQNGPGDPTRVTGTGRVTTGDEFMSYDVAVNAEPLSLTMMSRAYPLGLKGLMSGPIKAKGTTDDLELTMELEGDAGRISFSGRVDAYPLNVAARGGGRVDALDLSRLLASANTLPGRVTGTYQLVVKADTNDIATLQGIASAQVERADVDGIRIFASRLRARFADGRVHVDTLRLESTAATLTAAGALGIAERTSDSLSYQLSVDSLGGLRRYVSRLTSAFRTPVAGSAADSLAGSITVLGSARGSLREIDVTGRLTGTKLFIRREAGNEIAGAFSIANALRDPHGDASIRFKDLNVGGIALDTLGATVRFSAPRQGAFTFAALASNGVTLAANGDLALDGGTSVTIQRAELRTDSSRWSLRAPARIQRLASGVAANGGGPNGGAGGLSVDSLVLANGRGGRISLGGVVPDSGGGSGQIHFRADSVSLHDVGRVAQLRAPFSGWAQVSARGEGTVAAPRLNMQARLTDVRYGGARLEQVVATADYTNRRAQVALDLARGGRTALVARGSLPIEMRYFGARLLDDSLRGTIRTDSASFDLIEAVVPGLRDATGKLVANVDVGGTWKHPDVSGALRVENGEVTLDTLGIRMRGVNVDIALFGHRDSLAIRRLGGWSGASAADSLSLTGYVAYRDFDNPYLNLRMDARTFRVFDKRAIARLDVSTDRNGMRLRGQLRGATLTGALVVDRGTIFLPDPEIARKQLDDLSRLRDDTTLDRRYVPTPPSRLLESILIDDVRITLGDEVRLRSREADIALAGSLNVQRTSRRRRGTILGVGRDTGADSLVLALDGVLVAERGTYTLPLGPLIQREFQVEEGGTITFYPTPELAPELNISALHTVRTASGTDLRIRVRITGPLLPNPIVTLESAESFTLSQSNLVSHLIFGQPEFELGTESRSYLQLAAQTVFPTLSSFGASQLRSSLGSLGDIVQLRPGSFERSPLTSGAGQDRRFSLTEAILTSRIGAEKQITNNLFVSVSTPICQFGGAGDENSSSQLLEVVNGLTGKIEYRLSRDASLKAGKEPSAMVCGRATTGRVVPTPSQWGLSLFKTWRF